MSVSLWQKSRWDGEALEQAAGFLGTLEFFWMSFYLRCVKYTKRETSPRPQPDRHLGLEP